MKLKALMLQLLVEANELGERYKELADKQTMYAMQIKTDGMVKIETSKRIKEALIADLKKIESLARPVSLDSEWQRDHVQGYNQAIEEILELYKE